MRLVGELILLSLVGSKLEAGGKNWGSWQLLSTGHLELFASKAVV